MDIAIQKTDITPRQYLELMDKKGSYYDQMMNDTKCMNISDAYVPLIVEKVKKTRGKKKEVETTEKPPKEKQVPKPKPKKANGLVQIENGKVLNFDQIINNLLKELNKIIYFDTPKVSQSKFNLGYIQLV